jgi:hypothetical protein
LTAASCFNYYDSLLFVLAGCPFFMDNSGGCLRALSMACSGRYDGALTPQNRKLYKELIAEHTHDICDAKHLVKYRDRFVYIKCVSIDLFGTAGYAYVSLDIDRRHDENKKYMLKNYDNADVSFDEMNAAMKSKGLFILVSSEKTDEHNILPLYYQRQAIEQVFDIGKHNADLLPLRMHGVDTFRGHLFLSFLTSVAYIFANKALKNADVCAIGAYRIFRNLKCKVYDDSIIVQEPNKKMNEIADDIKLLLPLVLAL